MLGGRAQRTKARAQLHRFDKASLALVAGPKMGAERFGALWF